ncbi:MAG: hypothetical protein MJZ56_05920 [Bacteroidales bacterium]|nr:hypothetical protein [Bacteroidales bacterium]
MKKHKFSLMNLYQKELEKKQCSKINGGEQAGTCGCGCNGPSSTCDNAKANWTKGLHSAGTTAHSCKDSNFNVYAFWLGLPCY